ncbi:MAG: LPS export ABC transporter permease LptF [Proteobacteria bacterium]|nr:LPS export ABC transporter permease LptF [Pseudomonadota bacterium]MDA1355184.1 LPS export ABC transporter permease LptF [Pseudomonadota bacterium]
MLMHRHQSYILRQLLGPFLLITVGLSAVIWLTQSLRFIDMIVNKGLSLSAFLYFSMLLLPTFLGVILPIALFSAILFTYNKLVIDSEVVSLRTAGFSQWSLAAPALTLATFVCILVYAINLYFIPASYREFKSRQFVARADFSSVLLQEGVFTNLIEDVTVFVRERDSSGRLHGILVHDKRVPGQPVTMMAERGALVKTEQSPRFVLLNGNRQEINKARGQLSLLYFDSYALDLGQFAEDPANRWREPRERYLHELFNPSDGEDDQRNLGKFYAEAHQRIASPLFAFALTGIALATLLGGQLNRRGQWRRILAGIAAAFVFEAIGLGLVNAVSKSPGLAPLIYLNVALTLGFAVYFLNGRSRFRRARADATPAPTA